uniref:Uncharacterized protein n=1 Tax=Mycena chlorophos TaxID=658473 RepID=A0ABQ0LA86_MYCCL|nr:predicted protein [Mycena chlorophos]
MLAHPLDRLQPRNPVLRELLQRRAELCPMQLQLVHRPNPQRRERRERSADAIHQRPAILAKVVGGLDHGRARVGTVTKEAGDLSRGFGWLVRGRVVIVFRKNTSRSPSRRLPR